MQNYKFVFVILHYNTFDETIICVNSILNNVEYDNFYIVIVDNNSPNQSGEILKEKFNKEDKIEIILNEENLGFAKGNNVGFNYAKHRLNADFIALINNDTYITQSNFITKIIQKFSDSAFHILGPDIISTITGEHQNPRKLTLQNKSELKGFINLYSVLLVLNYFNLDLIFQNFKKSLFKKPLVENSAAEQNIRWDIEQENVKLHGSALIFSNEYLKKYDGLNPNTFMYSEEAILHFTAKRDKLKMLYSPEIKIFHKEDSTTNSLFKKDVYKRRFYYKNFIKSGKVLLNLMEDKNIV